MARLAIYDRTQNINEAATPQSLGSPRDGADGGTGRPTFPADSAAGADVYRELQELREMWHEDKRELDKVCPLAPCPCRKWRATTLGKDARDGGD